jgi:signal transduction histidine kinase
MTHRPRAAAALSVSLEVPPAERAAVWAAYETETARSIRTRVHVAAGIFLGFCALAVALERIYHPERGNLLLHTYLVHIAICAAAVAATRVSRLEPWTRAIALTVAASLLVLMIRYNVAVGGLAERCAMFQVSVLTAVCVLLPWGWRAQVVAVATSLGGFVLAAPSLTRGDALVYCFLALVSGAAASIWGALFLERSRRDVFVRTALLTRASAVKEEQAEIAAALLRVGQTLNAHVDRPDLLERVTQLAVEALGCDSSYLFLWDDRRGAFRLGASVGMHPDLRAVIEHIEFPRGALPAMPALRRGGLVEIEDATEPSEVPAELLQRFEVASVLNAPILRRGELIGVLTGSFRQRVGPFSSKQRRLALGIAQATAMALENARLIEDLQRASQLKSEFVATMSHELRTPLNVITGYTDLLADGSFGALSAPQQDTVERMRRSALELFDLVNATLDLGRLEAGRETVALAPVDLEALFAELGGEVEALVAEGVALEWWNEVGTEPIVTDRVKLKTVLKNLVGNALKFTSRGRVAISAAWGADRLTLCVADTGIGIPPDALPVIFEMFRQVDGSHTRRFRGVGLGLHIVKRLIDLLGGTITVTSTPDVGSTFTITLPARHAEHHRATGT